MPKKTTPAPTENPDLKKLEESLLAAANRASELANKMLSYDVSGTATDAAALLSAAATTFTALKQGAHLAATVTAMKEAQSRTLRALKD